MAARRVVRCSEGQGPAEGRSVARNKQGGKPAKDAAQASQARQPRLVCFGFGLRQVHHYPPKEMAADVGALHAWKSHPQW